MVKEYTSEERNLGDLKVLLKLLLTMRTSVQLDMVLVVSSFILLLLPAAVFGRHVRLQSDNKGILPHHEEFRVHKDDVTLKEHTKHNVPKDSVQQMLQIAGSNLPDCSHACGACFPCKRVSVSFKCSVTDESESCPMAYRCMCKGKFFPIP